ncbi:DNA methyltransferase [Pseudomonas syringae]|uniref:DNA adenine methylase n=1 Tax=Pseudomonas syringae TaxID=317 RepID=UPI0004631889|nr:DNA adenine methylase [Pseudomonas syringae]RXU05275.1 DNA methyltransferase [Pseudomonas syringae]UOF19502.1 DNA adenine methylase [Pseudomonas syringae CC440]UZA81898.1 DNA adenine methylase [Pseudomonas syringae]
MSIAPSFVTPLRYPGGKGRLGAWLAELIKHNDLRNFQYIEPYAGGAGAAVFLLLNNLIDRIVINDIDLGIYSFWWAVFHDTENLINLISDTAITMDSWEEQKAILLLEDSSDLTKLGFATFFMNRTNRSGIIRGGVIGGKAQSGQYKLDARFNKAGLISRINVLAQHRARVKITNLDALSLIENPTEAGHSLYYLDPPYYKKGAQLYRNHYKPSDHLAISQAVAKLHAPWIVTYDNCQEICQLYDTDRKHELSFHYSTHLARPIAKEVMFYGNLNIHREPTMRR